MKTTLDAVEIVWKYLSETSLKTTINGVISKHSRPINSSKEDVVINGLPINNAQLQEGVLNINIHVPNKTIKINDVQDSTQPDSARLKTLTTLACNLLNDIFLTTSEFGFDVQQQTLIEDEGEWYSNIRVQYYSINLN